MTESVDPKPLLDIVLEGYDSKFRYVLLAATRAEQLVRGARPKVDADNRRPSLVAMEEFQRGMVPWSYGPPPVSEVDETQDDGTGEGEAPALEAAEAPATKVAGSEAKA